MIGISAAALNLPFVRKCSSCLQQNLFQNACNGSELSAALKGNSHEITKHLLD